MYLKSITLKGFKSFPERTRLEFGPGVSVIVGPNGSGKSNVTDAVLWALGEQSPVAVRGQSMQDVIFAGAPGRQASRGAEVELVLDDSDGTLGLGTPEVSIVRRLDRTGEGEYRLAGARCRLVDVIELLSDTGLGKEMHSVISQGRVESLVTSKPRDRRLADRGGGGARQAPQAPPARAAEARSAPRTTSTERSTSSARREPGCGRSSARPRRPSSTPGSSARRSRLDGSLPATRSAPSSTSARPPRPRPPRPVAGARRSSASCTGWPAVARRPRRRSPGAAPTGRSSRAAATSPSRPPVASPTGSTRSARPRPAVDARLHRSRETLQALRASAAERGAGHRRAAADRGSSRRRWRSSSASASASSREQLAELEQQRAAAAATVLELARSRRGGGRGAQTRRRRRSSRPTPPSARPSAASRRPAARRPESAASSRRSTSSCAASRALRAGRPCSRTELEVDSGYELAVAAALDGRLRAALVGDHAEAVGAARPGRRRGRPRARRCALGVGRRPPPRPARPSTALSGSPITSAAPTTPSRWRGRCCGTRGCSRRSTSSRRPSPASR